MESNVSIFFVVHIFGVISKESITKSKVMTTYLYVL